MPVSFCLDWGSATLKPVYGSDGARVQPWLDALGHDISMVHLQQGDGILNRHWDFSGPGMIDPGQAAAVLAGAGLAGRPVFLEVHYPFERTDRSILAGLHQSCAILSRAFGAGG